MIWPDILLGPRSFISTAKALSQPLTLSQGAELKQLYRIGENQRALPNVLPQGRFSTLLP